MTIKHKCGKEVVENKATTRTHKEKSYDEHAAMHYDCSGWSEWTVTTYIVDKCNKCGRSHELDEHNLI